MTLIRAIRRFLMIGVLGCCFSVAAQAQVQASLVAADRTAQPGHPVTVALRLIHQPTWHTYWLNAGTGYPTSIEWQLPDGWTAGPIEWPTPTLIRDVHGSVTGHGYEGVVYLPMDLHAPASASGRVTLNAHVKWLMCSDVCVPGGQDVSLSLPVSGDTPEPDPQVRDGIAKMSMPQSADGWTLVARRSGNSAVLRVSGPQALTDPHFFPANGAVQYDQPQTVIKDGGTTVLQLPMTADGELVRAKLTGVLAYTDAGGTYRGVWIDAPFGRAMDERAGAIAGQVAGAGGVAHDGRGAEVGSHGGAAEGTQALSVGVLALAFLGGLILNLMPCVFPVLGIKIVGFVNEAGSERRKVTLHGLMFAAGVLLSFWALAGVLAALRAGGQELGWGFQLQSAPFVFSLCVIMLAFALSLSGVFEFGVRATSVGSDLQTRGGIHGSFFAGILATVVATPCSAPFLAPALGAALALPVFQSFIVFTAIGLGLSAPYLLLSVFPEAVRLLPRPGIWMNTFKQIMAFPLYATVSYLVWVLAGQTTENGLLMVLLGLTLIAMAIWLYGHYNAPGATSSRARFGGVAALALLLFGLRVGWPLAASPTDIKWEPWSAARVEALRKDGRPIYVDFTARWCATCQANKKVVFSSEAVKHYIHEHGVVLLKADWTNSDPNITAELAKWNRSAVPFNLVYLPGTGAPKPLPEVLTPSIVLAALQAPKG
jgi:thiol:disulfide interchange protein DsbD